MQAFRSEAAQPTGGRRLFSFLISCLLLAVASGFAASALAAGAEAGVALDGHVLPVLSAAEKATAKRGDEAPMHLTVVLRRADEAGFRRYLEDLYAAASPRFRQFVSPVAVADRFGPSAADYADVERYFTAQGFTIEEESANRLTLSVVGTRAAVEAALDVGIGDFALPSAKSAPRTFRANVAEPRLPAAIAAKVESIAGLADLARPARLPAAIVDPRLSAPNNDFIRAVCNAFVNFAFWASQQTTPAEFTNFCNSLGQNNGSNGGSGSGGSSAAHPSGAVQPWIGIDGSGQTIGLVEFDTFARSDVEDYLALLGLPAGLIGQVTTVPIGGGAQAGPNQAEVLLDIDYILPIARGADIVVYEAPFSGGSSYQAIFNRMINDGVDIISNSWSYCEDQTSLADVQSLDSVLSAAAASGVTVLNAAGDTGSTCLDGSANTVGVPAGAPHATAVGGSSQTLGPSDLFESEAWWDGSAATPQTGRGGFGASRFFGRPSYQDGFTAAAMRSVPDVVANADPAHGVQICQASAGGCPSPYLFGGTSMAAPAWAAYVALLNQAQGANLGFLNPALYPLSASDAFHDAAELGSDFAHVGLGSPNVNALHVALGGVTLGAASALQSKMFGSTSAGDALLLSSSGGVSADGETPFYVSVVLRDANGNTLPGKTVTLSAGAGTHATIDPPSATTNVANGAATFTVTDATIETLTFSAHVVEDNVTIAAPEAMAFVAPPAASAGIMAFPTTVPADGVSTTTITVTLRDADDQPSPGKRITLSQDGRSVVTGPDPPVTDANGEIVFTATDGVEETVTYTAVDETDGDLPVPGTAVVTFSGSAAGSCAVPPGEADGYTLTSFANGFAAYPFFYGNVNWGCRGATDAAFDADGNAYVVHFQTGSLYKFGPDGGSATVPLSTGLGPALATPTFGPDGRLYAAHGATAGGFFEGDVIEIDPETGALIRVVASSLACPTALKADPLSGDLFFVDSCFGAGSENPALFRITDPSDTDPNRPTEVVTYATLPRTPNGQIAFAPNGTIYVESGYLDAEPAIVSVTATDQPQPPIVTTVPDLFSFYWVNVGAALADGSARSLIVLQPAPSGTGNDLNLVDITTDPFEITTLAHDIGAGTIGPDGCLYTASADTVYKLAPEVGACDFAATNPAPAIDLTPRTVAPNPAQGETRALTAAFRNLAVPEGTPVFVQVTGANPQTRLVRTDAQGRAGFDYEGTFAGDDVIVAFATIDATTLISNVARIHWDAGPHATFIGITGPTGAVAGQPVQLSASLVDVAMDPEAPIAGASLHFAVGATACNATTAANGVASCSVTLANPGAYTLTVTYAGTSQYLSASRSELFVVPTDNVDLIFADGFDD